MVQNKLVKLGNHWASGKTSSNRFCTWLEQINFFLFKLTFSILRSLQKITNKTWSTKSYFLALYARANWRKMELNSAGTTLFMRSHLQFTIDATALTLTLFLLLQLRSKLISFNIPSEILVWTQIKQSGNFYHHPLP